MEIAKIIYRLPCPEERLVYLRFRDLERLAKKKQEKKGSQDKADSKIRLTERVLFDIL